MLVSRRTESRSISPFSQMNTNLSGKLGVNWPLVLQVGGWIITGVGLGMSVYDSITSGAQEANLKPGDLSQSDITALASTIAAKDPQGRSALQWEQDLTAMLGSGGPVTPQLCPPGSYRDQTTGVCIPIKQAGFFDDMSTGKMIGLGIAGVLAAKMLKLI